jgi:hypothetical protein
MHFFTYNPITYHLHQPYFNSYTVFDVNNSGKHPHHRRRLPHRRRPPPPVDFFFVKKNIHRNFLFIFPFFLFSIVFHLPFLKKLHLICADLELSQQVLFLLFLDVVFVKVGLNIFPDFVNKTLFVALLYSFR